MPEFDPGYVHEPFRSLVEDYPTETVYPQSDFRTEWGPIFHRGRLDGSARVLVIGQDPGQHENVIRRILVGEAGRRVQGFLGRLGITNSYVLINALLYSVYGGTGSRYVAKPEVRDYRNKWIQGILGSRNVEVVVTFGAMAKKAWDEYLNVHGAPANVAVAHPDTPNVPRVGRRHQSRTRSQYQKDA
jgi:uracil-DNA glycosylase